MDIKREGVARKKRIRLVLYSIIGLAISTGLDTLRSRSLSLRPRPWTGDGVGRHGEARSHGAPRAAAWEAGPRGHRRDPQPQDGQ